MTTITSWPDTIITAITHLSSIDPVMDSAIAQVGPCTLAPNPDIFEALVDAIISQQISVKAADAIVARVRAATVNGVITPEALVPFDFDALRALGLSTPKARYIHNLVQQVTSGQLDLTRLAELDDETVIEQLVTLKGIGRWTAEMILIFSLGRTDVLPVDDLGVLEGIREAYGLPVRPTRKEVLERGEIWRPYRTFATWYMWGIRRLNQRNVRERTRIVSL
ncbi:MAG TPA: DNA-3-methyladenine glycosylase [Ktedonobacteraceae bacterium]|jgi:DNA-3-methyladenine glycosylase II|nr:DNA-3-methyladenine glycosylase [Ktedonobacteraceae bacterium]